MSENKKHRELTLTGISASPGICIGKAYLVDREGVDVIGDIAHPQQVIQWAAIQI